MLKLSDSSLDHDRLTARISDLFGRALAKLLRVNRELLCKNAIAKDLDAIIVATFDDAGGSQSRLVNGCAVLESIKSIHVKRRVILAERAVSESSLGNATDEWHLATFHQRVLLVALTGRVTLVAFARCLAVTGAHTTTDTLRLLVFVDADMNIMKLH